MNKMIGILIDLVIVISKSVVIEMLVIKLLI